MDSKLVNCAEEEKNQVSVLLRPVFLRNLR